MADEQTSPDTSAPLVEHDYGFASHGDIGRRMVALSCRTSGVRARARSLDLARWRLALRLEAALVSDDQTAPLYGYECLTPEGRPA